jgi:outer membrane beta-barrel protein
LIRSVAVPLAALLLSGSAFAQNQFEGLDLTEDPKPEEKKPEEAKPPPPPEPATPAKPPPDAKDLTGERDITQDDRVKSVQRKLYLKRNRFELAPYVAASINDPFYTKFGVAVRGAYYLADTLALSVRGSLYTVSRSEDARVAKSVLQSRIFFSVPVWSAMADVEWSPLYGKVAFYNSILHFDAYLLGGAGVMNTQTSERYGLLPATDLGVGMRFVAKDFLAVNLALINTSYVDQPAGTTKGVTQNIMTLNAGISLFFPFKSTFREAE